MSGHPTLAAALPRRRFFAGEPVTLALTIHNAGAAEVNVPVPFSPARRGVRVAVRNVATGATVPLGPEAPVDAHAVRVAAGDFYFTETSLTAWHTFAPGAYQAAVLWRHAAGECMAPPLNFEVVAADAARAAFSDGPFADPPVERHAVATASGAGLGLLLERTFRADPDEDTLFQAAGDAIRLVADHPLGAPLPVLAAEDSQNWVVCTADAGLLALAGYEMTAPARTAWPAGVRIDVAAPAVETAAGELHVYSLRGDGPVRQLFRTRFAPPVTQVEEPEGPDDWDDEVLVPGPVIDELITTIDAAPGPVVLVRAGQEEIRLLTAFASPQGSVLRQVTLRGGGLDVLHVDVPGHPLPDAVPAAYCGGSGETVAVVLTGRSPGPDQAAHQVGTAVARFDARGATLAGEPQFFEVPGAPRSAAVAWSFLAGERPFHSWLVSCAGGSAHCGDSTGRRAVLPPELVLAEPVSLAACRLFRQALVPGDFGPTLRRIDPPQ